MSKDSIEKNHVRLLFIIKKGFSVKTSKKVNKSLNVHIAKRIHYLRKGNMLK